MDGNTQSTWPTFWLSAEKYPFSEDLQKTLLEPLGPGGVFYGKDDEGYVRKTFDFRFFKFKGGGRALISSNDLMVKDYRDALRLRS